MTPTLQETLAPGVFRLETPRADARSHRLLIPEDRLERLAKGLRDIEFRREDEPAVRFAFREIWRLFDDLFPRVKRP